MRLLWYIVFMKVPPKPFDIRLKVKVTFNDWNNTVVSQYPAGIILPATVKKSHYFVTSMGGIWFDEAEEII